MILFLYGQDTFRSRQKLNELKKKFINKVDPSGSSLVWLDGEKTSPNEIISAVNAPSLFAKKRMIIINGLFGQKKEAFFDQIKDFLKNLKKKNHDNIIVFFDQEISKSSRAGKLFKFLAKEEYAQEFILLSNAAAANWAKKEIEKKDAKISLASAAFLVSLLGSDLWRISNEANKLINYKKGRLTLIGKDSFEAVIEKEDIELFIRGKTDENIFAMTDAISSNNKALALKLFHQELDAGLAEGYLFHMIFRQFKILLQVRQGMDNGFSSRKLINQLKLHPYVVQKSLTQAGRYSLISLKNILSHLLIIDREVKTGKKDFITAMNLLMAKI